MFDTTLPGERAADDVRQSAADREERDDQLRRVAEARVQEAADARPGVLAPRARSPRRSATRAGSAPRRRARTGPSRRRRTTYLATKVTGASTSDPQRSFRATRARLVASADTTGRSDSQGCRARDRVSTIQPDGDARAHLASFRSGRRTRSSAGAARCTATRSCTRRRASRRRARSSTRSRSSGTATSAACRTSSTSRSTSTCSPRPSARAAASAR